MENGDNYLEDGHSETERHRTIEHTCSLLPSLVVPSLVSPFTNIVTAADAYLDTCVRAGEEHRDGRRPAGSQKPG